MTTFDSSSLQHGIRAAADRIVARHRQSRPAVLLVATRRSGSTLLRDLIAQSPGIRYVDQPESPYSNPRLPEDLRPAAMRHFIDPSADDLDGLIGHLSAVTSGETYVRSEWRLWRPTFHRRTDRSLLKLLDSQGSAGEIERRLGARSVVLFRDPIDVAHSIATRTWPDQLELVGAPALQAGLVDGERAGIVEEALSLPDGHLGRYVVETLVLMQATMSSLGVAAAGFPERTRLDDDGRPLVRFEDLRDDVERVLRVVYEGLELHYRDEYVGLAETPSRTTDRSRRSRPGTSDRGIAHLPDDEQRLLRRALLAFGAEHYAARHT